MCQNKLLINSHVGTCSLMLLEAVAGVGRIGNRVQGLEPHPIAPTGGSGARLHHLSILQPRDQELLGVHNDLSA